MSKLRSVSTAFWSDPFIEDLTPSEKLLFLYFITNEKTNMLGIYEVSIKKISFDTGLNKDVIEKALKSFERLYKVKYIKSHIVLVNFMKHQNYNTNMKKSAIDTYNALPKDLKDNSLTISKSNPLEGFERLLNRYGMVSKVEVEYEDEEEEEIEKPFDFKKSCISLGVEEKIIKDWLVVRKTKKSSNTETAFKLIKKEIELCNLHPNECIKIAVENSWSGFKSSWLKTIKADSKPTTEDEFYNNVMKQVNALKK